MALLLRVSRVSFKLSLPFPLGRHDVAPYTEDIAREQVVAVVVTMSMKKERKQERESLFPVFRFDCTDRAQLLRGREE